VTTDKATTHVTGCIQIINKRNNVFINRATIQEIYRL